MGIFIKMKSNNYYNVIGLLIVALINTVCQAIDLNTLEKTKIQPGHAMAQNLRKKKMFGMFDEDGFYLGEVHVSVIWFMIFVGIMLFGLILLLICICCTSKDVPEKTDKKEEGD